MHPGIIAEQIAGQDCVCHGRDRSAVVTFGELEATSNQGAHLFRSLGLERGDHIAILLENHPALLSALLGGSAFGSLLHGHQLAPAAGRGGIHRQQL